MDTIKIYAKDNDIKLSEFDISSLLYSSAGLAAPIPIPGARILGAIGGYTAGAATGEKLYNVGRKFLTRGTKIGGKTYADFKNMLTRKK